MNAGQIDTIIRYLRPNMPYSMDGLDLNTIRMADGTVGPSADDILSTYELLKYREQRSNEYPPVGDQLDAIMKGGQALIDMQTQCMAVKAKYPKPNGK